MAYYIVKKPVKSQLDEKKSVFICYLQKIASQDEAMAFVAARKVEHPDGRHHCWAFRVGGSSGANVMGISDDGEPHGTAGKPMLAMLQHKNIGDVVAVVVRYWGGVKLGTGGLVRAYSGAVQQAIEEAALVEQVELAQLQFQVPFAMESAVRHLLKSSQLPECDISYGQSAKFDLTVPEEKRAEFKKQLIELSNGGVIFS